MIPTPPSSPHRIATALTAIGAGVYALTALCFCVFGLVNGDEGWYLNAGRLVYGGLLPFRDFAWTQMPLTAYVYGLPQLAWSSLYLGRITSAVFALATLTLCLRVARRLAGPEAAATVALLLAAYPTGVYFAVLVKTYALTAFLFAATLTALTGRAPPARRLPVAVATAAALVLTRSSGLPLALAVVGWCAWAAPDAATRRRCLAIAAAGTLLAAFFVLQDLPAARFGLATIHGEMWFETPLSGRMRVILLQRLPQVLAVNAGFVALGIAALVAVWHQPACRFLVRREPGLAILFASCAVFIGIHLLPGQFSAFEYFVPVVPVLVTVTAIPLVLAAREAGSGWQRRALLTGGAAVAVSTLLSPGVGRYVALPGHPGSVAAVNEVSDYLRANTRPEDPILALWTQSAQVAADRDAFPEVSLGIFSYWDLPTPVARDLHFLNAERLLALLRSRRAAAVVLSELDRSVLERAGTVSKRRGAPERIERALETHYQLARSFPGFGILVPRRVDVYLRREDR